MSNSIEEHYDAEYFNNSQKNNGLIGGRANLFKFEDRIRSDDTILDFGCGGGFLLNNIKCKKKFGVELNPVARNHCIELNNIDCFSDLKEVPDESVDIVISNHCLEHTTSPFDIVCDLYKKLKPGGRIVICVPIDNYTYEWKPNDICNHLYSFSPMNLGNILQGAGFQQIETKAILHKWIPKRHFIIKYFGFRAFNILSWLYGNFIYNALPIRRKTKWNQAWAYGEKTNGKALDTP